MSAEFHEFGHAISVAFEANVAYTIVIQLSRIVWAPINAWIVDERARVMAALSETPSFNKRAFEKLLFGVLERSKGRARRMNQGCIIAAFIAATVSILLLCLLPFFPHVQIDIAVAILFYFLLFGPIAVGVASILVLNILARREMKDKSRQNDQMIELFRADIQNTLSKSLGALQELIKSELSKPPAS